MIPGPYLGLLAIDADALARLTELIAAHGVYALLAIFLFYQWRRSLKDYKGAAADEKQHLWLEHRGVVRNTYALLWVAVPVWIVATFILPVLNRNTVLWGSIRDIPISDQISPDQPGVKFYTHADPDTSVDPPVITLEWALVEDGPVAKVPFVFRHQYQESVTPEVPPDPTTAAVQPKTVLRHRDGRFVVTLPRLVAGRSFDYRYRPNSADPRNIGTIQYFHDGQWQDVDTEQVANLQPPRPVRTGLFAWFRIPTVHAMDGNLADVNLYLLGSSSLNLQLQGQRGLQAILAKGGGWDSVRKALDNPKSAPDHALMVRNLSTLLAKLPKTVTVPADVRLLLALQLYSLGDYNTAMPVFNSLSDAELGGDPKNFYLKGVANLQAGDARTASREFSKYVEKAPDAKSKSVARQTLHYANQKAAAKQ